MGGGGGMERCSNTLDHRFPLIVYWVCVVFMQFSVVILAQGQTCLKLAILPCIACAFDCSLSDGQKTWIGAWIESKKHILSC